MLLEEAAEHEDKMGPQTRELMSAMMTLTFPERAVTDDRRIRLAFRRFLDEGRAAGDVRDDVDLDTLTEVVVGTWYSMFLSWIHFDDYPLRERASAAAHFLASTFAAPREG